MQQHAEESARAERSGKDEEIARLSRANATLARAIQESGGKVAAQEREVARLRLEEEGQAALCRATSRGLQEAQRALATSEEEIQRLRRDRGVQRRVVPKPETRNTKPEPRNPKHETRNTKHETRNPEPGTRNPKPET